MIQPCIKCGGTNIKLADSGYSAFNVGGGKCLDCGHEVTSKNLGCFPTREELSEIWNKGNKPKEPEQKHRIVVCAVVLRDNKAVMQLRAPHKAYGANTWFFPGGKSEWGETVQQCTARELNEELGITVDPAKVVLYTMKEVIRPGAHDIMAYTIVNEFEGEPTNLDTKNTTKIEWFDVAGTQWNKNIHEPKDIWYEVGQYIEGMEWMKQQACEG